MGCCLSLLRYQTESDRSSSIHDALRSASNTPQSISRDQINGAAIRPTEPNYSEPSNRSSRAGDSSQIASEDGETQADRHVHAAQPSSTQPSNDLTVKIFQALRKAEVGGKEDKKIILPEAVKTIWAPIATRKFYAQRPWYEKSWDEDTTMDGYLRVMSILILINFTNWDAFRKLFIDQRRCDEGLPFEEGQLLQDDWLGEICGQLFFDKQWMFCPDRIEERQDPYDLRGRRHLPWIDEPIEIGRGAYGRVTKRTIAAGYLEFRGGTRNHENLVVAIKSVPETNLPKVEFSNLTELRRCLSEHTGIMVNLATMLEFSEHGGTTHHIVYELAAYDLNTFLTTPRHISRRQRHKSASPERTMSKDMWPGDLIQESHNLADALDFLHSRLCDKRRGSISLSHNDIRPENILVFYPESKDTMEHYPVGKWKFADFGLSRIKRRIPPGDNHCIEDNVDPNLLKVEPTHRTELSTSVSNTTPMRDPGRYTAPELDQDPLSPVKKKVDGRCADRWSLGCVLSEVITYAVKLDSRRVEAFREALGKPDLPNRRFYDHKTKNVKKQLIRHLDSLPNLAVGDKACTNTQWIEKSVELIKEIVIKDPKRRIAAGDIREKLGKIRDSMQSAGDKELWLEKSLVLDTTCGSVDPSPSPARSNGSVTSSPEDLQSHNHGHSRRPSQTPSINLHPVGQSLPISILESRSSPPSMERRRQTSPAGLNWKAPSPLPDQNTPKSR